MKRYCFSVAILLLLMGHRAAAQSKKSKSAFPTYDQVKPKSREMMDYDYAGPNGISTVEPGSINVFDYAPGTVTYVINGKTIASVKQAKRRVARLKKPIEKLSISQPDQRGKRVVTIE